VKHIYICLGVLTIFSSLGCAVNPVTGKSELLLTTEYEDIVIGENNYAPSRQVHGGDYNVDPKLQKYIRDIGYRLAATSDNPELPYEFVLVNSSVPNAWALPGGKIAINRGLLLHLTDEAQLAAVLAHEIVHAAARHSAKQQTRGILIDLGLGVLERGMPNQNYKKQLETASAFNGSFVMASYSRNDELESDFFGMHYMARAGYEPLAAVEIQQTFIALKSDKQSYWFGDLFSSHPPSMKRVKANQITARKLVSGNRYKERFDAALAILRKDASAYTKARRAKQALSKNEPERAAELMDKAIAAQPMESEFWRLRGDAWVLLQDFDRAEADYSEAISKNDSYYLNYLSRGELYFQQEKTMKAFADVQISYDFLPTYRASYLLGKIAGQRGDLEKAKGYLQAASLGIGVSSQLAQRELEALGIKLKP
jgi:predicted Zn-dependent protease